MNAADYRARHSALASGRATCDRCRKALPTCYCPYLQPFCAAVSFIILQHEAESRNAIATGRMAHLSMTNSRLFVGREFHTHREVNQLLAQPAANVLLYPGRNAVPLAEVLAATHGAPPVFWLLDAKWSQVPKMLRLSPNLRALPMVKFTPEQRSTFQIRRQPHPSYLSTIETAHFIVEQVLTARRDGNRDHDALLRVFRHLVDQQLDFVKPDHDTRHRAAKAARATRRRRTANPP